MLALRTWDFDLQHSLGNDISKIWMGGFISEEERALDELLSEVPSARYIIKDLTNSYHLCNVYPITNMHAIL